MNKFYCPSRNISGNRIVIQDRTQLHHIRNVLRFKEKDKITVFDEGGNNYDCIIEKISQNIILNIQNKHLTCQKKTRVNFTVACAIPKAARMDDIVDKLTQLGAQRIIPLETQRVVVKLDKAKRIARKKRWEKIALHASQQSGRSTLPVIEPTLELEEALARANNYDLKIIPTLGKNQRQIKEVLAQARAKNIIAFIGPEGDFNAEEISLAKKAGCIPVSLGDLVLRVETAAVAVASFIKFYAHS